jgi:hypothetical protein
MDDIRDVLKSSVPRIDYDDLRAALKNAKDEHEIQDRLQGVCTTIMDYYSRMGTLLMEMNDELLAISTDLIKAHQDFCTSFMMEQEAVMNQMKADSEEILQREIAASKKAIDTEKAHNQKIAEIEASEERLRKSEQRLRDQLDRNKAEAEKRMAVEAQRRAAEMEIKIPKDDPRPPIEDFQIRGDNLEVMENKVAPKADHSISLKEAITTRLSGERKKYQDEVDRVRKVRQDIRDSLRGIMRGK